MAFQLWDRFRKAVGAAHGHVGDAAQQLAPQLFLAAFGKHPGWNDHVDDIGLETDSLIDAKRLLYVQGIAGNLDAGAWDKLDGAQRVEGFAHLLLWHRGGDLLAGRLWSSSDGKGRSRYPMVLLAQCHDVPFAFILERVLPALGQLEQRCREATTAEQVIVLVNQQREALQQEVAQQPAGPCAPPPAPGLLATLAADPEMGPEHQGLARVLYEVEREMALYLRGQPLKKGAELRPQHLRVPRCSAAPEEALALWLTFLLQHLQPQIPLLVIAPIGQPWVDLLAGDPALQQLFCFRAGRKAVPLASEIPYTLDAAFQEKVRAAIAASAAAVSRYHAAAAQAPAAAGAQPTPLQDAGPANPSSQAPSN